MRTGVEVRPALASDAAAACTVLRRSIREVCGPDYVAIEGFMEDWLRNKTPANVAQWIANPDAQLVVAQVAGESSLVGVGSVSRGGEILLCYAVPEVLGRGVGRALLAALEEAACGWGLAALTAHSTMTARAFYERQGFRPYGPPVIEAGQPVEVPMSKVIAGRPDTPAPVQGAQ